MNGGKMPMNDGKTAPEQQLTDEELGQASGGGYGIHCENGIAYIYCTKCGYRFSPHEDIQKHLNTCNGE